MTPRAAVSILENELVRKYFSVYSYATLDIGKTAINVLNSMQGIIKTGERYLLWSPDGEITEKICAYDASNYHGYLRLPSQFQPRQEPECKRPHKCFVLTHPSWCNPDNNHQDTPSEKCCCGTIDGAKWHVNGCKLGEKSPEFPTEVEAKINSIMKDLPSSSFWWRPILEDVARIAQKSRGEA